MARPHLRPRAAIVAVCVRAASADLWDLFNILHWHSSGGPAASGANATGEANASGEVEAQVASSAASGAGSGNAPFHRFCGIATSPNGQNGFSPTGLADIVAEAGHDRVWHYNWDIAPKVSAPGTSFVPMIKYPGENLAALPRANAGGVGHIVKGWNEPDDRGQAGRLDAVRMNPEAQAAAWVADMRAAQAKGFTQFVSPAIAHDTVWLDFFLKGCEHTPGCKEYITYLACHRYHNDCGTYKADAGNAGWRDDLSYLVTMYRLMKKYNARGFNIKGIVLDELGCLAADWVTPAPQPEQLQYMKEFYRSTIVAVKTGSAAEEAKIRATPWIMPRGPDAHAPGMQYSEGLSVATAGGPQAGADAVAAIQSLVSVAWFSEQPGKNYILRGAQLNSLGRTYLDACREVDEHYARRRRLEAAAGEVFA